MCCGMDRPCICEVSALEINDEKEFYNLYDQNDTIRYDPCADFLSNWFDPGIAGVVFVRSRAVLQCVSILFFIINPVVPCRASSEPPSERVPW
mmetsp:Transcript_72/g.171  ORF Transcript_72/g.171 Transcript_72/m.171 type:complete len:93 (-) Transcript_72:1434-1712(-)